MKHNVTELLGLEDVILTNVKEFKSERHLWIELPRKAHSSPDCGELTDKVHDYREQNVKDISSFGKHTILHLRKRRYRCPACGKRFYEDNSFLPRYYRVTGRLCTKIIDNFRSIQPAINTKAKKPFQIGLYKQNWQATRRFGQL